LRRYREYARADIEDEFFALERIAADQDGCDVTDRLGSVLLESV